MADATHAPADEPQPVDDERRGGVSRICVTGESSAPVQPVGRRVSGAARGKGPVVEPWGATQINMAGGSQEERVPAKKPRNRAPKRIKEAEPGKNARRRTRG